MRTLHVLGLDVSLANTGIAVLGFCPDGARTINTFALPTSGTQHDAEPELLDRMDYLTSEIGTIAAHTDIIGIERPAYAAKGAAVSTLFGLWWLTYRKIMRSEVPVLIISPTSAKRYATGTGTAAKRDISRATVRMFPDYETGSGDEDDALILAAMAADAAELPVGFDRTKYRREALANLTLPDGFEPPL